MELINNKEVASIYMKEMVHMLRPTKTFVHSQETATISQCE
jgi:hypothetical protein